MLPRASSFSSSRGSGICPAAAMPRRLRAIRAMNSWFGMSGIIFCHVSMALTSAVRGPCISPILRSPARFISFSSNWKESSSIESISSAVGSASTTTDMPISSPRAGGGASVRA